MNFVCCFFSSSIVVCLSPFKRLIWLFFSSFLFFLLSSGPVAQTATHFALAQLTGLTKVNRMVVVQNKLDVCTRERALANRDEIETFLTKASSQNLNAPIIPCAAQQDINLDVLCQYIVEKIPTPKRDLTAPPLLLIVRSFDINPPGRHPSKLSGGVVGGSLTRGVLKVGDEIEIRPGLVRRDGTYSPLRTKGLYPFLFPSRHPLF
jgi:translation initiation factor 2 subunit 3